MTRTIALPALLVSIVLASVGFSQIPNVDLANSIIAARQKNNALLVRYTWTARTEIIKAGSVQDTRIQQVSYGPTGVPQYTLLNDEGAQMPRRFFRRIAAENEKEEIETYLKGLQQLVGQYTLPTAGAMVNFLSGATITKGTSPDGVSILQTTGNSVVVPGDTLSLSFDANTCQPRRMDINTTFKDQQVTLTATFRTLPSGLSHMQYATADVASMQLVVQIHNYDYTPNE